MFVYEFPEIAQLDVSILEIKIENGYSTTYHLPWRDFFLEVEVSSEGRLLLGKLRLNNLRLWRDVIYDRDSLLAHR